MGCFRLRSAYSGHQLSIRSQSHPTFWREFINQVAESLWEPQRNLDSTRTLRRVDNCSEFDIETSCHERQGFTPEKAALGHARVVRIHTALIQPEHLPSLSGLTCGHTSGRTILGSLESIECLCVSSSFSQAWFNDWLIWSPRRDRQIQVWKSLEGLATP